MEMVLEAELENLTKVTQRFTRAKITGPGQAKIEGAMVRMFKAQQKIVLKQFAKFKDSFEESVTPKDLQSIIGLAEDKTFSLADNTISKTAKEIFVASGHTVISQLGFVGKFDVSSPFAVGYLSAVGANKVSQINETTTKYLNSIVTKATDEGWSYNKTAKTIGERYEQMWVGKPQAHIASRAHFIAVTESGNAYMEGRMAMSRELEASGLQMEKFWSTMNDGNVSDGCRQNQDAGWIDLKKAFPSMDDKPLRFPGCRCDMLLRVKEGGPTPQDVLPDDAGPVYRDYGDREEAYEYINPHYEDWVADLDDDEKWAAKFYTDDGYSDMNTILRHDMSYDDILGSWGEDLGEELSDAVRILTETIENVPGSPEDMFLHRGFSSTDLWDAVANGRIDIGDIIEEKGFLSTSLSREQAAAFGRKEKKILYKIKAPKGSKLGYVEDLSEYTGELEAILAPGAQLEVLGIDSVVDKGFTTQIIEVLLK